MKALGRLLVLLVAVRTCSLCIQAKEQSGEKLSPSITKVDDVTRIYVAPVDKVYIAAAQVAAKNWNVTHTDKDTCTLSWKTGGNMRTFKGFEMSAVCLELPNGRTKVEVHPQKRPSGQVFSWGEGGRIATTFFEQLEKRLREMELLPTEEKRPKR